MITLYNKSLQPYTPPTNDLPGLRVSARAFYAGDVEDYNTLMQVYFAARSDYKDDRPRQVLHEVMMEVGGAWATDDEGRPVVQGACACRLASPWGWARELPLGSIGIVDGAIGHPIEESCSITFGYRAHIGPTGLWQARPLIWSSVSGGPGTIRTPITELTFTGEWITINAWRWRNHAEANGGEDYRLDVPLFDWHPGAEVA